MHPATYGRIFSNCHTLVIDYKRGEDLYELELEQSLIALAGIMIEESKEEVDWLSDFGKHCEWFESQIVGCFYFGQGNTHEGIDLGTH